MSEEAIEHTMTVRDENSPIPEPIQKAVCEVAKKVGKIAKEDKNAHGNYKFASVDAFLEATGPACAEAGLVVMMDEESCEVANDGLYLRFAFTLAAGGTTWGKVRRTIAVHTRMGAQAFGAAQSYALKQFLRALFQISTGDKEDIDHNKAEPLPRKRSRRSKKDDALPGYTDSPLEIALKAFEQLSFSREEVAEHFHPTPLEHVAMEDIKAFYRAAKEAQP